MKPQITYFLPGLLLPEFKTMLASCTPMLIKLLSRAGKVPGPTTQMQVIHHCFQGLGEGPLQSAALAAFSQDLINENNTDNWCFASLVECLVTHQTAYILGNDHLSLNNQELDALKVSLAPLFLEEGLTLYDNTTLDWLCVCENNKTLVAQDMLDVLNKDLTKLLPRGENSAYWNRLITMCQMQLQNCEVNKMRDLQHKQLLSSVWFWGMGALPKSIQSSFDAVYTDNWVIKGLGRLAKSKVLPLPLHFNDIDRSYQNILIYDDRFYKQAMNQNQEGFEDQLVHYEQQWFEPLVKALSKLKDVEFIGGQGTTYHVNNINIKFFWRYNLK
ncbi:MAG: hypothetical protein JSR17_02600 [Proteobacteria bacterium]|nr:hypothetical protein [Pseudomonadota bacterium]